MKRFEPAIILLLLALITAGVFTSCDQPIIREDTEDEFYDEAYGTEPRQALDVFLPADRTGNVPFVLMIHGGGWQAGDKENYHSLCETLRSWGYGAVTMNYRFAPEAKIPDMVEDIRLALEFLKTNAGHYDLQVEKTGLVGGSAGAHLALLYGYSVEESPIDIAFVVSQSGPANFANPDYPEMDNPIVWMIEDATGDSYDYSGDAPASWVEASPVTHIASGSPYTLICHGTLDTLVPYSEALAAALQAAGVPHDLVTFEGGGHGLDKDKKATARMYGLLAAATDLLMDAAISGFQALLPHGLEQTL
jgi:acetyl esterase/lipase